MSTSGASRAVRSAEVHAAWYASMEALAAPADIEPLDPTEALQELRQSTAIPAVEADSTGVLLTQAKGGSRRAMSGLLERYRPRVLQMVRQRLSRPLRTDHDSGDVVQDVFVETLRSLGNFEPKSKGSFYVWLRRIVENRILNLRRRQYRHPDLVHAEHPLEELEGRDESDARARRERWKELEQAIEGLPAPQREVIRLRYLDGLSYRKISATTGRTEAAVSMLLTRARAALAQDVARGAQGGATREGSAR